MGDELLGLTLGRYRVDRLLGVGGMGSVYAGVQQPLGRPVAIKVLHGGVAADEMVVRRFRREAEVAASLSHPNIAQVTDFGVEQGRAFLVMDLLEGESLAERIERCGHLDEATVVRFALQILTALVVAHARDVVHRDLKPENIFVQEAGGVELVKLLDFGIARILEVDQGMTGTGMVLGTPAYMSPEQARGKPVDARSDVFSLGAVLYETLTGARAFAGENYHELMFAVVEHHPPPITSLDPSFSAQLSAILTRSMAKNPDERFATAADMRDALARLTGLSAQAPSLKRAQTGEAFAATMASGADQKRSVPLTQLEADSGAASAAAWGPPTPLGAAPLSGSPPSGAAAASGAGAFGSGASGAGAFGSGAFGSGASGSGASGSGASGFGGSGFGGFAPAGGAGVGGVSSAPGAPIPGASPGLVGAGFGAAPHPFGTSSAASKRRSAAPFIIIGLLGTGLGLALAVWLGVTLANDTVSSVQPPPATDPNPTDPVPEPGRVPSMDPLTPRADPVVASPAEASPVEASPVEVSPVEAAAATPGEGAPGGDFEPGFEPSVVESPPPRSRRREPRDRMTVSCGRHGDAVEMIRVTNGRQLRVVGASPFGGARWPGGIISPLRSMLNEHTREISACFQGHMLNNGQEWRITVEPGATRPRDIAPSPYCRVDPPVADCMRRVLSNIAVSNEGSGGGYRINIAFAS